MSTPNHTPKLAEQQPYICFPAKQVVEHFYPKKLIPDSYYVRDAIDDAIDAAINVGMLWIRTDHIAGEDIAIFTKYTVL